MLTQDPDDIQIAREISAVGFDMICQARDVLQGPAWTMTFDQSRDLPQELFTLAQKSSSPAGASLLLTELLSCPESLIVKFVCPDTEKFLRLNKEFVWARALGSLSYVLENNPNSAAVLDFVAGLITVSLVRLLSVSYNRKVQWKWMLRVDIIRSVLTHPNCPCTRLPRKLMTWCGETAVMHGYHDFVIELFERGMDLELQVLSHYLQPRYLQRAEAAKLKYASQVVSDLLVVRGALESFLPSAIVSLTFQYWPPAFDPTITHSGGWCVVS